MRGEPRRRRRHALARGRGRGVATSLRVMMRRRLDVDKLLRRAPSRHAEPLRPGTGVPRVSFAVVAPPATRGIRGLPLRVRRRGGCRDCWCRDCWCRDCWCRDCWCREVWCRDCSVTRRLRRGIGELARRCRMHGDGRRRRSRAPPAFSRGIHRRRLPGFNR